MNFNKQKIKNVLKLANAYSQAIFNYVKFAQEDNSLLNSMIALNSAIKNLAATVKLSDPNDSDMASLVRSGAVLIDDFQNTSLPASHFMQRLHNMQNHLDTVKAMNYYKKEEDIYDGDTIDTPNEELLQKANIVSDKLSQVTDGLKNYKGKSGPAVPRKTFVPSKPSAPKPGSPSPLGQAYSPSGSKLEEEKARILANVDAGEYDLEDALTMQGEWSGSVLHPVSPLTQQAIKELQEEQEEFGFNPQPMGATEEELDAALDVLRKQDRGY